MLSPELLDMINRLVPQHARTSCNDDNLNNSLSTQEDENGKVSLIRGRCSRCSLLSIAADKSLVLPPYYAERNYNLFSFIL